MKGKLIYIIAGEPSGDLLGSRLMNAVRKQANDVRFAGTGGETMAEAGLESLFDISEISVMGIFEVIPRLRNILRRVNQTVDDIIEKKPDVLVTIDSWGFITQVLAKLKKRGFDAPKVHYVAPQVWAWKKGRAKKVPSITDRLLTLLPMEPPYFEKYGMDCVFVGHPVIENVAGIDGDGAAFRREYGIPESSTLITVLPGSRETEIKRLIPVFKDVVGRLRKTYPGLHLVIPSVNAIAHKVDAAFADAGIGYTMVLGQRERYRAFKASCFAVAASGTVSLELAACGTPHIIAYKFGYIANKTFKYFVGTKFANLINILAQRRIIPEFVLEYCTADRITPVVEELMSDPAKRSALTAEAQAELSKLKPEGMLPSEKAAQAVLEMTEIKKCF